VTKGAGEVALVAMFAALRQHWDDFKSSRPGRRFQDIHKRRGQQKREAAGPRKVGFMAAGVVFSAAGIFFMAVPGPGLVILAIGLVMIARESLTMARFLDWAEVKIRPVYLAIKRRWDTFSPGLRWTLLLLGSGAGLAVAAASYMMITR
jgi:hypothetical protein